MTRFNRASPIVAIAALAALSLLLLTACPPGVDPGSGDTTGGDETEAPAADTVAAPTASVPSGPVAISQYLSLACGTDGATVRYTVDGSEPTESSTAFAADTPIKLLEATTVKAKAYKEGMTASAVSSFSYTIGDGFTISWNGTRLSRLQTAAGSAQLGESMAEIFPLIDYASDRSTLALAVRDSVLFGDPPQFMLLLGDDFSADAGAWLSTAQFTVPGASFDAAIGGDTFPVTLTEAFPVSITFNGQSMDNTSISSSELIIDSYDDETRSISGRLSCVGTLGSGSEAITDYGVSARFKATLVFNSARNLGSAENPYIIPMGGATGMSAGGGTSYYRVHAQTGVNHFIIRRGLDSLFYPDYGPTGLVEPITLLVEDMVIPVDPAVVNSGDYNLAADLDFAIEHTGTGSLGASYVICHQVYPTFSGIAAYDGDGDSDGTLDAELIGAGSSGSVGDLGDYTTGDLEAMLEGFNLGFDTADVRLIAYGRLESDPYAAIFAARLSDDSWVGAEISLEALLVINERDPYYFL